MLEDDEGGAINISKGSTKAAMAVGNRVNKEAEMPVVMLTAEHRETMMDPAKMVGRAAVAERVVTRAGRVSVPPTRLVQEMGTAAMEIESRKNCVRQKCRFLQH